MAHEATIDRNNPGCMLFLIDQSESMSEPFGGEPGRSKAERLADAINGLLANLIDRCTGGPEAKLRNYLEIGVIGYGYRVGPALSGTLAGRDLVWILEIAENPVRIKERPNVEDRAAIEKFMIWFEALALNGTPMCQALQQARLILEPWVHSHPDSYPPIVVNITDGEATDGDPLQPAKALQNLATHDGNLLLFNLHLSSLPGESILYPESETALPDKFARKLFQMSSLLPPLIQKEARKEGYTIGPESRGFVFNADIAQVIKFLDIGTKLKLR